MRLWLIRHAAAEHLSALSPRDADRRLTEEGRTQFQALAERLLARTAAPTLIVSSPYLRAAETAAILHSVAGLPASSLEQADWLAPGLEPEQMFRYLSASSVAHLALVGHSPDMGECLSRLIGGGRTPFSKGAVACIDLLGEPHRGQGELRWMVTPKVLG